MPMKATVTGWDEMQGEAKLLRDTVRITATRVAVRAGADVVKAAMVERAPILDHKTARSTALEPGALREGMRRRLEKSPDSEHYVVAVIGPSYQTAHIARLVEYGHRLIKRFRGEGHRLHIAGGGMGRVVGEVPAYPFLRPAFEASEAAALDAFVQSLKSQLRKWFR